MHEFVVNGKMTHARLNYGMPANTITDKIAFQREHLQRVSRSFAFTIPQLPQPLNLAVGNAYLICRIADTIEDEPALSPEDKLVFLQKWASTVDQCGNAEEFSQDLGSCLTDSTPVHERTLVAETPRVIEITANLGAGQRKAISRCSRIMTRGMGEFQEQASLEGLANLKQLDRYCYHVAGVVGEMLTDLFCDYSDEIMKNRDALYSLSASHGQGLQMTNILKDVWDDHNRGVCWLPRDVFGSRGFNLGDLTPGQADSRFVDGMSTLITIASQHLANALQYILYIPARETGIRRHCLWPLGMAVLTLRRIHATPSYRCGNDVKITRKAVKAIIMSTSTLSRWDRGLKILFGLLHQGLPDQGTHPLRT